MIGNAFLLSVFGQVWQMLASVLHMSNLEFDKVDHEQGEIASISDREVRHLPSLCCLRHDVVVSVDRRGGRRGSPSSLNHFCCAVRL